MEVVGTWYSLIPPVLALVLVLLTRKVLISLGVSIVVGALMLNGFNPIDGLMQVVGIFTGIFYVDGGINDWEFYIILFLLLLGMMAALITKSGGSIAFAEWAMKRIKTRVGAQMFTIFLGFIIFIDDYFNSLTVGNISRPISDKHRVSRAKLAYLVDSTAAPMCVIAPISSWGAYIISIIGGILTAHGLSQYQAFEAFMLIIPMNYYALIAIAFMVAVALFKIDFGPMRRHEELAITTGQLTDPKSGDLPGTDGEIESHSHGKVYDLILPILGLVVGTVAAMVFTGYGEAQSASLIAIFGEADIAGSLVIGGVIGLGVALITNLIKPDNPNMFQTLWAGIKSMLPAIFILILAWIIIEIISDIGTGLFLAELVDGTIPPMLLPAIIFLIAGFTALSTGTSWGTFGLLLPIAGDMAAAVDVTLMLPMLAAVLAGAIFGDHTSPISDTTILSSAGAGSHHIDHVITQLPYAVTSAVIAFVGFIILGFTGNMWISLLLVCVIFTITVFIIKQLNNSLKKA
ncbi:sodium:proton antiporter [Alkalihalobacillus alcalophilus ATCC 27647 = CGMCC 1.3604]|uniref:Sodium:proton antiporter n=2 Tax=Alkalihalobacillus alcalophilus ATCC 27647 = CGMCC 1.3604 TaxID=1218173 RepID=A0A094WKC6_ALKAL|nr:Na+/H+ antiporter NhaC family protein [Alkalihalobacillus alcalophilus]KGA96403.1 sodium:proton antiporter [Alkalihalobacillus alcalophilus ATCC 27647 = CGMCC 1.3604]MED1560464.1 Na+/H+ antiporter NhaC family protein [Alkalihalobacillus alcalophilus]THG90855.1 sodium:proton antiporter [Alkalihalobacillus alcalophilus ATCC 27647 = CGMCC 1.3604]